MFEASCKAVVVHIDVEDQSEKSSNMMSVKVAFDVVVDEPFLALKPVLTAVSDAHKHMIEAGYIRAKTILSKKYDGYCCKLRFEDSFVAVDGEVVGQPYMDTRAEGDYRELICFKVQSHVSKAELQLLASMISCETDMEIVKVQGELPLNG